MVLFFQVGHYSLLRWTGSTFISLDVVTFRFQSPKALVTAISTVDKDPPSQSSNSPILFILSSRPLGPVLEFPTLASGSRLTSTYKLLWNKTSIMEIDLHAQLRKSKSQRYSKAPRNTPLNSFMAPSCSWISTPIDMAGQIASICSNSPRNLPKIGSAMLTNKWILAGQSEEASYQGIPTRTGMTPGVQREPRKKQPSSAASGTKRSL